MCLAIPGKIIELDASRGIRMGKADFGGVIREICLEALPEARLGDYVIVHAGFALNILSEEEAQETLKLLHELSEVNGEFPLDDSILPDSGPGV